LFRHDEFTHRAKVLGSTYADLIGIFLLNFVSFWDLGDFLNGSMTKCTVVFDFD